MRFAASFILAALVAAVALSTATATATATTTSPWQLVSRTDFNTAAVEGTFLSKYPNWYAYAKGSHDTSGRGMYDPGIVSVHDGVLDAYIRTTNGVHRIAAFGPRFGTSNSQLYGRYEVRARVDSMHGYKGAWLLWPKSEVWPRDGEIDFPEGVYDSSISAFMHRQGATSGSDQAAYSAGVTWNQWHTYVIEWTPSVVRFIVDGRLIGAPVTRIPNTPMRWALQTETTLSYAPANTVQGHVLIDYAAVWAYRP